MINAYECIIEIKVALKQFGEHGWFDVGPHEVMDMNALGQRFFGMTGKQIADVLVEVKCSGDLPRNVGEVFAQHVMVMLDDRPDLDELYIDPRLEGLY